MRGPSISRGLRNQDQRRCGCRFIPIIFTVAVLFSNLFIHGQTASTGALTGVTLDPSDAVVPGVSIHVVNQVTGAIAAGTTDNEGRFGFALLSPGPYHVQAVTPGSNGLIGDTTISINVTETLHLEFHLQLATVVRSIKVSANSPVVQT